MERDVGVDVAAAAAAAAVARHENLLNLFSGQKIIFCDKGKKVIWPSRPFQRNLPDLKLESPGLKVRNLKNDVQKSEW